jgi:hypothetical protein
VHVIENEARARQTSPDDGKKVHQERGFAEHHTRGVTSCGDFAGPHGGRSVPNPCVNARVIRGYGQDQPALQLTQCQRRVLVRVVTSSVRWVREGGPRQLVHRRHRRSDDAFDDPAVVRSARRTVFECDGVLGASAAQRFAFELGGVVEIQLFRLPCHRPLHLLRELACLQPCLLLAAHAAQAQPDRYRRRRLQSDDEPEYGTAEDINGDRQVGAADRLPLVLVNDHQIDDGVVDLDLIENPRNRRWTVAGGLTWAGGIGSSA